MDIDMDKLVEAQVRRELEAMDLRSIIDAQICSEIKAVFKEMLKPKCVTSAEALIESEIEKCMDKEVETDDGWGKKNKYESFEMLFRKTIKGKLNGSWEMKRVIENLVKERCASLMKKEYGAVCEKITDELTKSRLVKK